MLCEHYNRENNEVVVFTVSHQSSTAFIVIAETCMLHAAQSRQTGAPEVLNWTPIEVAEPGWGRCACASGKVRINANQRFALKDAADAHKRFEERGTSGSAIFRI